MSGHDLHNVAPPVSATVAGLGIDADMPGAGLIEFRVPRYVVETVHLGETWILSRATPPEETQQ